MIFFDPARIFKDTAEVKIAPRLHQVITVSFIQHTTYGNTGSSSSSIKGDSERDFFVELWDVSGHDRYKDCRSLFYSQINGEYQFFFPFINILFSGMVIVYVK